MLRRIEQPGAPESDRHDRVVSYQGRLTVIDYKFGERRASYHNQVKRYMHLLQAMGYDNVDGYLWYFNDHGAAGIERVY